MSWYTEFQWSSLVNTETKSPESLLSMYCIRKNTVSDSKMTGRSGKGHSSYICKTCSLFILFFKFFLFIYFLLLFLLLYRWTLVFFPTVNTICRDYSWKSKIDLLMKIDPLRFKNFYSNKMLLDILRHWQFFSLLSKKGKKISNWLSGKNPWLLFHARTPLLYFFFGDGGGVGWVWGLYTLLYEFNKQKNHFF